MGIGAALGAAAAEWDKKEALRIKEEEDRILSSVAFKIPEKKLPYLDEELHIKDVYKGTSIYNPYTKISGTKATRNNNPGNISGMSGKLLYGASKIAHSKYGDEGDQAMLVFDNPDLGWKAMHGIMSSEKYNKLGIRDDFKKYQSDQKAWKRMQDELVQRGINIDKRFIDLSPEEQIIFMTNRAQHEGYKGPGVNPKILSI